MSKQDKYAIRCSKCNTVFGVLAHMTKFNKRICNKCCPTSKYDSNGLFLECSCQLSEEQMLKMIPGYKGGKDEKTK